MGAEGAAAMAGMQLFQAYGQAQSMEAMGEYQNTMSRINARNAELQAESAQKKGLEDSYNYQKKVSQVVGAQKVAYAAQGVDIGYGSAKEVQAQTVEQGKADVMTIKNNAFLEAMGYRSQAQEASRAGRMAQLGAQTEAASTLIGGGIKAAQTYYTNK